MLKARTNVKAISEARQADSVQERVIEKDNDPELPGEAKSAMKEMCEMNTNACSDLTLEERVTMLNADQSRMFDNVKSHLLHQKRHDKGKC